MDSPETCDCWKMHYFELLKKETGSGTHAPQAFDLKIQRSPSSLYRYRKFNPNTVKELLESYFWMSAPDEFNDPFDSALLIQHNAIIAELFKADVDRILNQPEIASLLSPEEMAAARQRNDCLSYLFEIIQTRTGTGHAVPSRTLDEGIDSLMAPDRQRQLAAIKNWLGICSFCENSTSTVMWGHYAAGHTGIAIEYDTRELLADENMRRYLHPVIYAAQRFDSTADYRPLRRSDVSEFAALLPACHKSPDWSYEQEWRLVIPTGPGDKGQPYHYSRFKPKRILIGAKATVDAKRHIESLAKEMSLAVSVGQLSRTDFSIVFN